MLLRACRHGDIARIGLRRPREATPEVTVRASFLAALALQNGAHRQSRRIQLLGAWVEGRLDLGECRVPASLWFFRCVFDTTPLFDGARIQGGLAFPDCELPGLLAERCRIAQDLSLNAGCSIASEVRLQQARIAGDFNATRLSLVGQEASLPARRSLLADGIEIAGDLRMADGFDAAGEVRFAGARVGGDLVASGARVHGPVDGTGARRCALVLDRVEIGGDLRLDQGFAAAGSVSARRARIGGDMECCGAAFDRVGDAAWGEGVSLVLDRARIRGTLRLARLEAPLLGASFVGTRAGALVDDAGTWGERLVLDGFAYSRFGDGASLDSGFRLGWLERQLPAHLTDDFRMQPWQRVIEVLRRMGRGGSAGTLAVRREQRLRRIGRIGSSMPTALRGVARVAHACFGALAGYGWRPQRRPAGSSPCGWPRRWSSALPSRPRRSGRSPRTLRRSSIRWPMHSTCCCPASTCAKRAAGRRWLARSGVTPLR
ncbi:hypothetical protein FSC37_11715 [Piscinibacter aquaticus]|uniref:Uncharacterized protein n=1 Tax=Piscinibacter aquaticus TaxID=392597 RepID=A0A5C6U2V3_9BURK|nr:hypothetical protein FSC37_11715 [Piscinibacter aquaticus]